MMTTAKQKSVSLPEAAPGRWRPLRSGLLNLFRYDHEEFHYENGHLLLRGNNGTGKSRVLALQLPFLLDGEVSPHRLEPDGDASKRISWNLLMGRYENRLGYTWIEFGRRDDDDICHYITLGCGLHAVKGRDINKWFFVTDRRVGKELFLQAPAGQALNQAALVQALDGRGQVYTTAQAYRAAVDAQLFGLGPRRYAALVDLLIKLRQPQLSRKLDEKRLTGAISGALPPPSDDVLQDVADSFHSLETDEEKLKGLREARRATQTFLGTYRRYAQVAARRRAGAVRSSHAKYESTMRSLREHEAKRDEAAKGFELAKEREVELAEQLIEIQATIQALDESPQMQDAHELKRVEQRAKELADEATSVQAEKTRALHHLEETSAQLCEAEEAVQTAQRKRAKTSSDAAAQATALQLGEQHQQGLDHVSQADGWTAQDLERSRLAITQVTNHRRRAAKHLQKLSKDIDAAAIKLDRARAAFQLLESQCTQARDAQGEANLGFENARDNLYADTTLWADGLTQIPRPHQQAFDGLVQWCDGGLDGNNPLVEAVLRSAEGLRDDLQTKRADLRSRRSALDAELDALQQQHAQITDEGILPPPKPHTRAAEREQRPGAPLWKICDFRDDVDDGRRARLEAALEASGLLDAWVGPDGYLLADDEYDTSLVTTSSQPTNHSLLAVLEPAIDEECQQSAAVAKEVVHAILARIGLGEDQGAVWIADDGQWRVELLRGRYLKDSAEYIGEGARETKRRTRLAELEALIANTKNEHEEVTSQLEQVNTCIKTADRERDALPPDTPVRTAWADLQAANSQVARLHEQVVEAERKVQKARLAHEQVVAKRARDADDCGMSRWVDKLAEHNATFSDYCVLLERLWSAFGVELHVRKQHDNVCRQVDKSKEAYQKACDKHTDTQRKAQAEATRHATLAASVGAAAKTILARRQQAVDEAKAVRDQQLKCSDEAREMYADTKTAQALVESTKVTLEERKTLRTRAIAGLATLGNHQVLALACPQLRYDPSQPPTPKRAVELARELETQLREVACEDKTWSRLQTSVHTKSKELEHVLLEHEFSLNTAVRDELHLATATFRGQQHSMHAFEAILAGEIDTRESILSSREREIIEDHLIRDVAKHLHTLIHDAQEWIDSISDELTQRPTSTGMKLRFKWIVDPEAPAGLAEARELLLKMGTMLPPADSERLGTLLHNEIKHAREDGTWKQRLRQALDYRAWHRIVIERHQDGVWKRLTRKTHGTGSGGEKAIALTLPQFAAASAHYTFAEAYAPRLILLDEAFVGVDSDMRGKCMGILNAFDLDFVMTSEREWCCYATLPGVAIYQLAIRKGLDAVGVTRWRWNGRKRERIPHIVSSAKKPPPRTQLTLVSETTKTPGEES